MEALIQFISQNYSVFLTLHLIGFAFGLGGATVTDLLFFKFMKDYEITNLEASVMRELSKVLWASVAIQAFTGLCMFLANSQELIHSAPFQVKMVAFSIIVINGLILNLELSPKLAQISFKNEKHRMLRRIAFATGAISIISWYSAFLFAERIFVQDLSFPVLLSLYVCTLFIGVIGSQVMEHLFLLMAHHKLKQRLPTV